MTEFNFDTVFGMDETITDWFAIQSPKIFKAFILRVDVNFRGKARQHFLNIRHVNT